MQPEKEADVWFATVPPDLAPASIRVVTEARASRAACKDDVSQRAANLAKAAVPDSLPPEVRRERRNAFISKNRWRLFDANSDGRLTFEEYLDSEWAGYLAQLPAGECRVTRQYFLMSFLGDPNDPRSYWKLPYQEQIVDKIYRKLDRDRKGYITRDDLRSRAMDSFKYSDKGRKGYLVPGDI